VSTIILLRHDPLSHSLFPLQWLDVLIISTIQSAKLLDVVWDTIEACTHNHTCRSWGSPSLSRGVVSDESMEIIIAAGVSTSAAHGIAIVSANI
jgi:hypothetical protein